MGEMQNKGNISVSSTDSQGAVHIAGDAVYRTISANQEQAVRDVVGALDAANVEGLVATEICADAAVAARLSVPPAALVLKHRKVANISYAHEWCGAMLKDAALFQLDLSERLLAHGLYLKDAHPWNILFEKGTPVFVDYTSVVPRGGLEAESYLAANRALKDAPADIRLAALFREIFAMMFIPYFVNPLCGYAFGDRARIRRAIEDTTLNTSSATVTWRDALPSLRGAGPRRLVSALLRARRLFKARAQVDGIQKRLEENRDIAGFLRAVRGFVAGLKVEIGSTAYSTYYQQKGEDSSWDRRDSWNGKQKSVHDALNVPEIASVLDVACNTGWYTVMAEKLGKRVIGFDIDEGCIETLYGQVKREKLNVLPLVMNFTTLTQDRYSVWDGKKMLINAADRLRSDAVIVLGIIHHLVLGLGMRFDEVLDKLDPLCGKRLVIEFVDKSDDVIRDEPSFFPAYFKDRSIIGAYDAGALVRLLEARGFDVTVESSHPATRSILVCTRRGA